MKLQNNSIATVYIYGWDGQSISTNRYMTLLAGYSAEVPGSPAAIGVSSAARSTNGASFVTTSDVAENGIVQITSVPGGNGNVFSATVYLGDDIWGSMWMGFSFALVVGFAQWAIRRLSRMGGEVTSDI